MAHEGSDPRERLAGLGEVAAGIAHELRNLLQVISTTAYVAAKSPAASAPHIATIERTAREAHALVDDLMALARGDALGALPLPLADVLAHARTHLPPETVYRDTVDLAAGTLPLHAPLAARLFHALYENAAALVAPRPAVVETWARRVGDGIWIDVTDDGPGVPAAIAGTLFDPLVSEREGGTGLGLALAARIARAHGGALVLAAARASEDPRADGEGPAGSSPSPGGARFRVILPADEGARDRAMDEGFARDEKA